MNRPSPADHEGPQAFAPLLQAARDGDRTALGWLLESCRADLLLIAQMEVPDRILGKVDPLDVVQDTFLEAQRGFGGFHGATQPDLLAWLRGILRHNLIDLARQFHCGKRAIDLELALDDSANEGLQSELLDDESTPSSKARSREWGTAVQEALARLAARYREVIHYHDFQELSFDEIGPRLGKSAEAARKLWERAIKELRAILGPFDDFP